MKLLINNVTKKEYLIEDDKVEEFIENYENPQYIISYDVWYCDGSGWNGKESKFGYGFDEINIFIFNLNGKFTNNEMEYEAVIRTLYECSNLSVIFSDSQLVINQINGLYQCKSDNLKPYLKRVKELSKDRNILFRWIPREQNIVGIELDKL